MAKKSVVWMILCQAQPASFGWHGFLPKDIRSIPYDDDARVRVLLNRGSGGTPNFYGPGRMQQSTASACPTTGRHAPNKMFEALSSRGRILIRGTEAEAAYPYPTDCPPARAEQRTATGGVAMGGRTATRLNSTGNEACWRERRCCLSMVMTGGGGCVDFKVMVFE